MEFAISTTLLQYAQGAAAGAIAPVADFLAPTVDVPTTTGRFKKYNEKSRFRIPNTQRAYGGDAVQLKFDASDELYSTEPHSFDIPVEHEAMSQEEFDLYFRYAAGISAGIGALDHEKRVITAALAAAGEGTGKTWSSGSADPVDDLDAAIQSVLLNAKYGSLMSVGVLFGTSAFRRYKNNANVRGRYIVGKTNGSVGLAVPTMDSIPSLLIGNPDVRCSFAVVDAAPEGKDANPAFALDNDILVFARQQSPNTFDPSFMKTFRLMGKWMTSGTYMRQDNRVQNIKFDWNADVKVTNSAAVKRLVIS